MQDSCEKRQTAMFERLPADVGTVFLAPSETLRYLTGLEMHKSERPTLVALGREAPPSVVLPQLETDRVREVLGPDADFFVYEDATDPVAAAREAFARFAAAADVGDRVAAEYRSTRLLEQHVLGETVAPERVVDAGDAVAAVRGRKDESERDRLREAARIIDEVLAAVVEDVEPGATETDVARDLHRHVLESDADGLGTLIVASGPNTAKPHTNTGRREIQPGDPLIIDAGVICGGYHSDITRTFVVGEPPEGFADVHDVVRRAARVARETVAPGVPLEDVDAAAREVITEAGYGEYFTHRVGHGLGLEGHEPPYLVAGNEAPLEVGHAVTVEPGAYLPDLGGARVEDDLIVTADGAEVLTSSPRELRVI